MHGHCMMSYGLKSCLNFAVRAASSPGVLAHFFQSALPGAPAKAAATCAQCSPVTAAFDSLQRLADIL